MIYSIRQYPHLVNPVWWKAGYEVGKELAIITEHAIIYDVYWYDAEISDIDYMAEQFWAHKVHLA